MSASSVFSVVESSSDASAIVFSVPAFSAVAADMRFFIVLSSCSKLDLSISNLRT